MYTVHPVHNVKSNSQHERRHGDIYCTKTSSQSTSCSPSCSLWLTIFQSNPSRYHLQVHAPTLSGSSVCLKQEMRWKSTAKNNTPTTLYTRGSTLSANPGSGTTLLLEDASKNPVVQQSSLCESSSHSRSMLCCVRGCNPVCYKLHFYTTKPLSWTLFRRESNCSCIRF